MNPPPNAPSNRPSNPGETGTIDLGNAEVYWERQGAGPHVVLVHGWPLTGRTWRNVVPNLTGLTTTVIDLPGAGRSAVGDDFPMTIPGLADSLVQVLDRLNLDSCALMAQDSGGMLARMAAARRPERVKALVLSDTEIPHHQPLLLTLYVLLGKLPGNNRMLRFFMGNRLIARSPLVFGSTFADTSLINADFRRELIEPLISDADALRNALRLIRNFTPADVDALETVHDQLTMPSLLVWGQDNPFFPEAKARAMASQFAGETEFVSIADAKLFMHEEHPEALGKTASEFLLRHLS